MDNKPPAGESWWRRFLALPNDDPVKTVAVTVAVAFCGSILVAGSAVLLKPLQTANKAAEQRKHFVEIIRQLPGVDKDLVMDRVAVETRVVDLESGEYDDAIDPARFDQRRAAKDPTRRIKIPPDKDLAGLKYRERSAVVYLVRQAGQLRLVILPVRGRGFASTLYGYLGLAGDGNTVVGLSFYQHGETPGLGALIDDPAWKMQWRGKTVWDAGALKLGVGSGRIEPGSAAARYQVDGLTGATWTGRGVTNLLHYWLGEHGFGPYLRRLKRRGN
jgi:Na+-transporting NADH:ubiquinone oxidoreductase subunit C